MKTRRTQFQTLAALSMAVILAVASGVALAAQAGDQPDSAPHPEMTDKPMMQKCHSMMAKSEEMQAKMSAMDSKLDSLVAEMNSATGKGKIDAVAAVVAELVDQRKAMHGMMMHMQPRMMRHMMGHMQGGMMQPMGECPMMQKMSAGGETAEP